MRSLHLFLLLCCAAVPCASAQASAGADGVNEAVVPEDPVTPDIAPSATAAVTRLGEAVVLGKFDLTLERMNPEWKERAAKAVGGIRVLEQRIAQVPQEMVRQGIAIISFRPQGKPIVYQVDQGKRIRNIRGGVKKEAFGFRKWLVLVPTTTRFRIQQKADGLLKRNITIEKVGFQVAISDKDQLDWTFIDGAGLKVGDLRNLFPTLPLDIELPEIREREIP